MNAVQKPKRIHGAHNITCLIYHLQITVKYRLKIINEMLSGLIKSAIHYAGFKHGIKIYRVGTDENHAHIYFQLPPTISISQVANYIKGISSRIIRINMPCLKLILPDSFWTGGFWCVSVGNSWEDIDKYIANQGVVKKVSLS